MKLYKALVWDKYTKRYVTITSREDTKTEFIKQLRNNGYRVNPIKVKEAAVFDYIVEHTNCYEWDWKEIKKVPTEKETELTKKATDYLENNIQAVNTLVESSVRLESETIEFNDIESKRFKLTQRSGLNSNGYYNVSRYKIGGKKTCGYIFDGRAREYTKTNIVVFDRHNSYKDIRNLRHSDTLVIEDKYLGVTFFITVGKKGLTYAELRNPDGSKACEHEFETVIKFKQWFYHISDCYGNPYHTKA